MNGRSGTQVNLVPRLAGPTLEGMSCLTNLESNRGIKKKSVITADDI